MSPFGVDDRGLGDDHGGASRESLEPGQGFERDNALVELAGRLSNPEFIHKLQRALRP